MPTSAFPSADNGATFSFTRTREQLAIQVLEKLRVLQEGETAQDEDKAKVYDAIDMRLKELHALGILWFNVNGVATSLSLSAGLNTVLLPPYALFLVTAQVFDTNCNNSLEIISNTDYHSIQDPNCTAIPEKIFVFNGTGYLWPIPDKNYTLNITYEQVAADTAISTQPNVDVSMLRALKNLVTYDLCDVYSVPEDRISRLAQEATNALNIIRLLNAQRTSRPRVKFTDY